MNIEIENEIDRIDIRIEAQKVFKELLNSIDGIVREEINDEEKADELIKEIIISFLEISEGNYKEKKVSREESLKRSRVKESAHREKRMRDYIKQKRDWKATINAKSELNKKIRLLDEKEKKYNETPKEIIDRLMVTRR